MCKLTATNPITSRRLKPASVSFVIPLGQHAMCATIPLPTLTFLLECEKMRSPPSSHHQTVHGSSLIGSSFLACIDLLIHIPSNKFVQMGWPWCLEQPITLLLFHTGWPWCLAHLTTFHSYSHKLALGSDSQQYSISF